MRGPWIDVTKLFADLHSHDAIKNHKHLVLVGALLHSSIVDRAGGPGEAQSSPV